MSDLQAPGLVADVSDLIERLWTMVHTPNVSFHYKEDVETARLAADALTAQQDEIARLTREPDEAVAAERPVRVELIVYRNLIDKAVKGIMCAAACTDPESNGKPCIKHAAYRVDGIPMCRRHGAAVVLDRLAIDEAEEVDHQRAAIRSLSADRRSGDV